MRAFRKETNVARGARVRQAAGCCCFLATFVWLVLGKSVLLHSQTKLLSQGEHHLELTLELKNGSSWRAVDPGLVFQQDDHVRFRVRANFEGYLYVMNQSTSGNYATLFPTEETGQANKIAADKDYLVPATEGWFRITGPPGQETVYWLVSPSQLPDQGSQGKPSYVPLPPPPKSAKRPANLIPRCDDSLFKARGDCIDTSAGVRRITDADNLPENLATIPGAVSRELTFVRNESSTLVSSPVSLSGPVIFEIRLAHR
jgi:Domain of unknown function (DUF4384)